MIMRGIIYSPLTAGILVITIFFILHATFKIFQTYSETKKEYEMARDESNQLKQREYNLKEKVQALKTERGVEEEVRNKFGFVKEGEEVIVIVEPPIGAATGSIKEDRGTFVLDTLGLLLNIFR